jgi:hypothetical protein
MQCESPLEMAEAETSDVALHFCRYHCKASFLSAQGLKPHFLG